MFGTQYLKQNLKQKRAQLVKRKKQTQPSLDPALPVSQTEVTQFWMLNKDFIRNWFSAAWTSLLFLFLFLQLFAVLWEFCWKYREERHLVAFKNIKRVIPYEKVMDEVGFGFGQWFSMWNVRPTHQERNFKFSY